jgi:hypothetical protein
MECRRCRTTFNVPKGYGLDVGECVPWSAALARDTENPES